MTDLLEKPETKTKIGLPTVYLWDVIDPSTKKSERHCVYYGGKVHSESKTADMLITSIWHKSRKNVSRDNLIFIRSRQDTVCNQASQERCHFF
jgi:hypothetical protein